jgi:peptidoglycan/LPS O-acetylase OafA/YrhL
MTSIFPTLRCREQSRLDSSSTQSMLIALLRGLAALQVAAAHLRAEIFPGLRELADPPLIYQLLALATAFSHQAVVVFFLISGWLVGGSLLDKLGQPGALRNYAIDRATRLWTVLLPGLCLMLVVGAVTGAVDPGRISLSAANDYSGASFVGNLLGLQTVLVEPFGGNYALWSLSNETWYYVQFPLLLLMFAARSAAGRLGAATALVLLATALPFPITLYFALWLLGAAFSRIRLDCGPALRALLVLASCAIALTFRLRGGSDDLAPSSFFQHLAYSLPLLLVLASLHTPFLPRNAAMRLLARGAHVLAEFSFTLYVMHLPLIALLRHLGLQAFGRNRLSPYAPADYAIYFGLLAIIVALSWLLYLLFEARTFRIRRAVKDMFQARAGRSARLSTTSD